MSYTNKAISLDLAIIGAGPAGLAAATKARSLGLKDVVVFDRDEKAGGILSQCIHPGFGLLRYGEALTGPEYAWREIQAAVKEGAKIELDSMVTNIDRNGQVTVASSRGVQHYRSKSIILAMGCRERTRPAVRIPGTRPAGVFTAGKAQRLVNIEGRLPGRRVVIVGSGDIGMIMARRLTLEGCYVEAVVEINPFTSGLIRNEVQCLHDFNIPLLLGYEVTDIRGYNRVEEITVAAREPNGSIIPGTERAIACDTVLLSVGLIPENELSRQVGIFIDPTTNGPKVDNFLETDYPGMFACGNVLHVNDLVDEVSFEGELAAEGAVAEMGHKLPEKINKVTLTHGNNIGQLVPQELQYAHESRVAIRVRQPTGSATLRIGEVFKKRLLFTRPGEMIIIKLSAEQIKELSKDKTTVEVTIACE